MWGKFIILFCLSLPLFIHYLLQELRREPRGQSGETDYGTRVPVSGAMRLWVTNHNLNTHVTSQRAAELVSSASTCCFCKYLHLPGSAELVCSNVLSGKRRA
ncbi:uncharacterized [Tachysurus ichikawai]